MQHPLNMGLESDPVSTLPLEIQAILKQTKPPTIEELLAANPDCTIPLEIRLEADRLREQTADEANSAIRAA